MLTSTCLEQFISRKFFQDRVDILDPDFIQKVEVGIADTILENYKKIKSSMIQKRKEYFEKKNEIYSRGMSLKLIEKQGEKVDLMKRRGIMKAYKSKAIRRIKEIAEKKGTDQGQDNAGGKKKKKIFIAVQKQLNSQAKVNLRCLDSPGRSKSLISFASFIKNRPGTVGGVSRNSKVSKNSRNSGKIPLKKIVKMSSIGNILSSPGFLDSNRPIIPKKANKNQSKGPSKKSSEWHFPSSPKLKKKIRYKDSSLFKIPKRVSQSQKMISTVHGYVPYEKYCHIIHPQTRILKPDNHYDATLAKIKESWRVQRKWQLKNKGDIKNKKTYKKTYSRGPLTTINKARSYNLETFNKAATIIQKYIRGFAVRVRFKHKRKKYLEKAKNTYFRGIRLLERQKKFKRNTDHKLSVEQKFVFKCAHNNDIKALKRSPFSITGRDVNCFDQFRYTPLHICVEKKYNELASYLIFKGAKLNTRGPKGFSPLHMAFIFDNLDFVDVLVNEHFEDCDFYIKDYQGNFAHQYMVQLKVPTVLKDKNAQQQIDEIEFRKMKREKWIEGYLLNCGFD